MRNSKEKTHVVTGRGPFFNGLLARLGSSCHRLRRCGGTRLCWTRQEIPMPDEALRVAYDEADITPPLGGSMPGYFRDRKATGTLDPLKAKVLYVRQDKESVALVACDLIGMGAETVGRIRKAVATACKNPPRHVWV